jgi:hypothetical protein
MLRARAPEGFADERQCPASNSPCSSGDAYEMIDHPLMPMSAHLTLLPPPSYLRSPAPSVATDGLRRAVLVVDGGPALALLLFFGMTRPLRRSSR